MKTKISYNDFNEVFTQNGYSKFEVRNLFSAIKSMDKETRAWVIKWFWRGELPQKEIEGVNAKYLIEQYGLKPINAFIILDWLKSDPQTAKYYLYKHPGKLVEDSDNIPESENPGESIREELDAFYESKGITPKEAEECDTTDIE